MFDLQLYYWSKGLRYVSDKPSHKHDSNKYQTKAFVIRDHKSDQTRSATHVNKTYLVWLMYWLLFNQHYQRRPSQKLRSWANAVFQNRGVCGEAFPSLPSPSPLIPFFLLSSQFSRRTCAETLAMQVSLILKAALLILTLKLDLGGRQQRFSTWNVTMLRNKLSENVACITWP